MRDARSSGARDGLASRTPKRRALPCCGRHVVVSPREFFIHQLMRAGKNMITCTGMLPVYEYLYTRSRELPSGALYVCDR